MIREVKFESLRPSYQTDHCCFERKRHSKTSKKLTQSAKLPDLIPYKTCEETQPICFENAKWAYVVGSAIALKKGCKNVC